MLEILKTLKDTPLPIVLVIGGLIFLLIPFIQKIQAKEVGVETANQSFAGFIGVVLLLVGIGLYIIPSGATASTTPTVTQVAEQPAVIQPTAVQVQPTQVQSTSIDTAPTAVSCSGIEPLQDRVLSKTKKEFTVTLGDGEVVVGQGWQFWYGDTPVDKCYAFIIDKPGTYTFSLYDGAWSKYKVCSSSQAESLLQGESNSLATFCNPILTRRIP
jgi:uncharacterized protein YjeT (DUF2065 family)